VRRARNRDRSVRPRGIRCGLEASAESTPFGRQHHPSAARFPNPSVCCPDLDVLWHILHGDGQLITEVDTVTLRPEQLVWLPRLSRREIAAGEEGLTYLTVHPDGEE
jgi:hypothetical protein